MEHTFSFTLPERQDYKAYLYDCDGTLANNMHLHKQAYALIAQEHGFEMDVAIIDELAGLPTIAVVAELNKRYNLNMDPAVFGAQKSQRFVSEFLPKTTPIEAVVTHLKVHAGKAKIGVVSGGSRSTVTKTLEIIGVLDFVDVMVCAGETALGKPAPDPFLAAVEQLGIAPVDCLVFEDGNPGIQAAKAAGMDWVKVEEHD